MRKEKVINPKELRQELFEAECRVESARRHLYNNEYGVTETDVAQAEQHYQQVLSEWQALPPPPVLPPSGKLEKITGRLETFSRIRCKANFDPDVYATSSDRTLTAGEKGAAGAGAIAIGSPALAGLALKGEETVLDDADYVQGMINGQPFAGWVGMTHLKAGDEVELAAAWQDDHYQVYAIAVPALRIVSVCPRCSHGRYIQAISDVKISAFMTLLMFIIFSSIGFFMDEGTFWENLLNAVINNYDQFYLATTMMLVLGSVLWGLFFYGDYKAYAETACKLAEEIFQVFGWRNPKWINLKKITAKREKELMRQGKWYSPKDNSKPPLPSAKLLWDDEYWHYY
ncbi:putative type VI secretion system effector [Brenneria goodwinii]|uniref:putative type VI secretion system effector n=1 Tax=Brenneria goodwinii TaxID=1109412 RepID=UPI0036E2AE3A